MRTAAIGVGILAFALGVTSAQEARPWAEKLFLETGCETSHDFKSVAHGAILFHKFTFKNPYKVPLEVNVTRVSCGCITAVSSAKVVQANETGSIDATMNTRQFTAARNVSIHVQFTHPQYFSTAELKVSAFSRPDVVFNPGHVQFGAVPQGQGARQEIEVDYAGTLDWRVNEVAVNGLPVEVRSEKKKSQAPGQVGYKLTVMLKPEAPAGPLKGEMFLKTSDPTSPLVPVLVEATVQPALSVAPSRLPANVKVGEERTFYVSLRGVKDFRLLGVEGQGEGVTVAGPLPAAASASHRLAVKVRRDAAGEFRRTLQVKTDAQAAPVTVTVEGSANP